MRRLLLLLAMLAAPVQARTVTATVYDPWYSGRPDYCTGRAYQHWGISAAHPWLPCGTRVTVTHRGRSLVVPIRDRCDCNSIDLSAGAAYRLGVPLDGIARVGIEY
jgi:rare lipoprotein A (peptidoglycan hydrolase)